MILIIRQIPAAINSRINPITDFSLEDGEVNQKAVA
jgi:hypothetical protein